MKSTIEKYCFIRYSLSVICHSVFGCLLSYDEEVVDGWLGCRLSAAGRNFFLENLRHDDEDDEFVAFVNTSSKSQCQRLSLLHFIKK